MDHKQGFESLNSVLNKYPDSYQQGEHPTVVIFDSEQYVVALSMALHPFSDDHRVLVLELVFNSLPFFKYDISTKSVVKRLNKKVVSREGFEVKIWQESGHLGCGIGKSYYSPIDLEMLERDRAIVSALALVVFQALSNA